MVTMAAPGASAQATSLHSAATPPRLVQSFGFIPAATIVPPTANAPFRAVLVERTEDALADGVNINRMNQEVRCGMARDESIAPGLSTCITANAALESANRRTNRPRQFRE